jgi:hypothetical protein
LVIVPNTRRESAISGFRFQLSAFSNSYGSIFRGFGAAGAHATGDAPDGEKFLKLKEQYG